MVDGTGTHHDPAGPFGYARDMAEWDAEATNALKRAQTFADEAARSIAESVVVRAQLDSCRGDHSRRARAAERYASAVLAEAQGPR